MTELPESITIVKQINTALAGKRIKDVIVNQSPHGFGWHSYNASNDKYKELLAGKEITEARLGISIVCEDAELYITTPIKYHEAGEKLPLKHQLLIAFDDGSHMSCTVQMWGAMFCGLLGKIDFPYERKNIDRPSPLSDAFNKKYFETLIDNEIKDISVKALLATEQRIPDLGNGVLQDILFNAQINPKRKISTLTEEERDNLFNSIKLTLKEMTDKGGRDTERNLFGKPGGYKTILSAKTITKPCRNCGGTIKREAYLGGNIYYCPVCQE